MPSAGQMIQFKAGLYVNFAAIASKDVNTIYFCTDTQQIFVGDTEYSRPVLSGAGAPSDGTAKHNPPRTLYFDTTNKNLYVTLEDGKWVKITDSSIASNLATLENTVSGINTRLGTAEGEIDALQALPAADITQDNITSWNNKVGSVSGGQAIDVTTTGTDRKVALKLDTTTPGNVALTQSNNGLKASVTIPAATVTGVATGEQVLALTGTELTSTLSLAYDSANKKIQLKGIADAVVAELDATAFIKDGMVDSVAFDPDTKILTITFNTDAGKEAIDVDLASLVDTYTAGNGIDITGNVISIKVDSTSESFLSVGAGGVKLSGVQTAIDAKVGEEIGKLDVAEIAADATACEVIASVSETDGKIAATKAILPTFTKGQGDTAGKVGLVPAPTAAESTDGKFLKADGTWDTPVDTKVKLTETTSPIFFTGAFPGVTGSSVTELMTTKHSYVMPHTDGSNDMIFNADINGNATTADAATTADSADYAASAGSVQFALTINGKTYNGGVPVTVPTASSITGTTDLTTDKAVKDYVDAEIEAAALVWGSF